jgi:hypothetical protein
MLASTVQFSNNDQPPAPHARRRASRGRRSTEGHSLPQDPTACPALPRIRLRGPHPRRGSTGVTGTRKDAE